MLGMLINVIRDVGMNKTSFLPTLNGATLWDLGKGIGDISGHTLRCIISLNWASLG